MTADESNALRSDMATMLSDSDCLDFINKLFNMVHEQNPHIKADARDLLNVFDKVGSQPRGGLFYGADIAGSLIGNGGGYAYGSVRTGDAKIVLGDASFHSKSMTREQLRIEDAVGALHEDIHHLAGGDTVLSHALATLRGVDPNPFNYPYSGTHSLYWGQALDWHCGGALKRAIRKGAAK